MTSTFSKGDRVRLTAEGVALYDSSDEVYIQTEHGNVYLEFSKPESVTVEVIRPTAREQFDALPLGTVFRVEVDTDDVDDRVKITPTQYTYIRGSELKLGATTLVDVTNAEHWWNRGGRDDKLVIKTKEVK